MILYVNDFVNFCIYVNNVANAIFKHINRSLTNIVVIPLVLNREICLSLNFACQGDKFINT